VLHIAELARNYEANGGLSFRGFVEELRFGGDAIETGGAPILEEGNDVSFAKILAAHGNEDLGAKSDTGLPLRSLP
ncbi:MAG TPA: hypothetical protein VF783_26640, partial [Terriglobales bacterium]